MATIAERANRWIVGRDTGVSSKLIWRVMMGVWPSGDWTDHFTPHDPDDFGRCYRLLELIPEWRERLGEVATVSPTWAAMVERWAEIEVLYKEEVQRPDGRAPKCYALMKEILAAATYPGARP